MLFIFFDPKIYFITATNLIVTIFTVISNIKFTKELLPEVKISIDKFNKNAVKTLLSSGVWNSINQLSNILLNQLDLIIINVFVGSVAAGQYSIVKIIPSFILTFISMITSIFIPKFMILYANKKEELLSESIDTSIKILAIIISLPIGFLIVFGSTFFKLWVPGENNQLLNILSQLTLIPLLFTGCGNMIFNIFTITNKLKIPALVMVGSGIIKTIFIYIVLKVTKLEIFTVPIVSAIVNIVMYLTFIPIYASKCVNITKDIFYKGIYVCISCTMIMSLVCLIVRVRRILLRVLRRHLVI